MTPETRYARSGDVHIAYQVIGDAPRDLVVVHGWVSNIETCWEHPVFARFLQRLASFSRVIQFDKRGTGLSDRVSITELPSLEQRMDDVRAVMDAAGSERAALYGYSEGGALCALFAATYPERTSALIMQGSYAKRLSTPDYPWGVSAEQGDGLLAAIRSEWGGPVRLAALAPSLAHDQPFSEWWARYMRQSASPAAAAAIMQMSYEIDVRPVLPAIRVPTLIIHRTGDRAFSLEGARYLARHIAGSKLVELASDDHMPWVGSAVEPALGEIEELLTGVRQEPELDRILATVLFTDIVGSTDRLAELGDRRWRDVLDGHHTAVRRELTRFRGREVHTTGDGFLATFDGPARATRCAVAIAEAVRPLGLEVRAGVHTGEIELMDGDIGGIAVHIGARVAAAAGPGEVLVSSTVKDLVAGSGIAFEDRGMHSLKGVPGEWRLFSVASAG
jgi:class 3 adenylate cyclase